MEGLSIAVLLVVLILSAICYFKETVHLGKVDVLSVLENGVTIEQSTTMYINSCMIHNATSNWLPEYNDRTTSNLVIQTDPIRSIGIYSRLYTPSFIKVRIVRRSSTVC
jgi:hypothetical protein